MTREAVDIDTPAIRATSEIVTFVRGEREASTLSAVDTTVSSLWFRGSGNVAMRGGWHTKRIAVKPRCAHSPNLYQ